MRVDKSDSLKAFNWCTGCIRFSHVAYKEMCSKKGELQIRSWELNEGIEFENWRSQVQILNFAAYLYFLFCGVKFNVSVTLSGT